MACAGPTLSTSRSPTASAARRLVRTASIPPPFPLPAARYHATCADPTGSRRVPDRRRPGALLDRARQRRVAARGEALADRLPPRAVDVVRDAGPLRPATGGLLEHARVPERRLRRVEP